jgi:hypothetical protein
MRLRPSVKLKIDMFSTSYGWCRRIIDGKFVAIFG